METILWIGLSQSLFAALLIAAKKQQRIRQTVILLVVR